MSAGVVHYGEVNGLGVALVTLEQSRLRSTHVGGAMLLTNVPK